MRLIDADAIKEELYDDFYTYEASQLEDYLKRFPTIEAEPVRHGRWIDRYGGKYANHLYECSECKGTALYKYEVDVLDNGHFVQALSAACPHCRAKMDGDSR